MKTKRNYEEDGVQDYLKAASTHPVLNREEEIALFQRLESGDDSAREDIAGFNLRFVIKIAMQYQGLGVPLADLIQEGNIGLLYVIDKFDWRKGFRFSTYAAYYIRQEIQAALHRQGSMIRLPIRKARMLNKINEYIHNTNEMEGRDPGMKEIALALDIPVAKIEPLLALRQSFISVDAERSEDGMTLLDAIPSTKTPAPSDALEVQQSNAAVHEVLNYLTDRERKVVELRFGLGNQRGCSLRKASKVIGLSQEGVRRIEHRALNKLRRPAIRSQIDGLMSA